VVKLKWHAENRNSTRLWLASVRVISLPLNSTRAANSVTVPGLT